MISMTVNDQYAEVEKNDPYAGRFYKNTALKLVKTQTPPTDEVESTIGKANELRHKDFMPANDTAYRQIVSMMNVSDNERVFSSRENVGKAIVTCCDRLDRVRQQCAEYIQILLSEPKYFIRNEIEDKMNELEREEIILITMRDALVKMYDAYDTIIKL